ncbi:hypothetical protein TREMEDRAFT_66067 [Tremella mesenterica DSM 1558]|uniref:uncharacterized protein n=1 Tax=Tremella mesenterica (strain ATCC 24925 / CBS 8224 / DSM 1558 / NBRC 9311 / NRRL Y-6157 / RJB 2259-6 / UBC 559-6) TaxID=578456 RepID=UPI00032C98C1|nr:uncharacterized protein TREMEDRAFT_66067 [Tremella mesenterica DSM 1558]EIW65978.1 hypothetical protein TREMEDRAFT_66067 [Tremella mesenterica DSM 1558]
MSDDDKKRRRYLTSLDDINTAEAISVLNGSRSHHEDVYDSREAFTTSNTGSPTNAQGASPHSGWRKKTGKVIPWASKKQKKVLLKAQNVSVRALSGLGGGFEAQLPPTQSQEQATGSPESITSAPGSPSVGALSASSDPQPSNES